MRAPTVTLHKVRRRGGDVWMLRWYGTTGKRNGETIGRASKGKMTKTDAEVIRRERQSKMDCGLTKRDRPRKITLGQFIEQDRAAIQADVKPTTLLEYDHTTKHLTAALGDHVPLARIGRAEVGRLKRHLQKLGRKPATIRKTVRGAGTMMGRALADGLIQENPFRGAARGKTQPKTPRFFRPEDVEAMFAVCPTQWWRVMVQLAVTTGLRRGELWNLCWSDLDFEAKTATVTRKDAGRFKVKDRSYPIFEWSAKDHEERTVPLPDRTVEMLRRFQLQSGGSRYVFIGLSRLTDIEASMTAGHWKVTSRLFNNFNRDFRRIQDHARIWQAEQRDVKLDDVPWVIGSPHDLRKTYGNTMKRHVSADVLKELMGHANISTTMKYYTGGTEEDAERVRTALSAEFGRVQDTLRTHDPNKTLRNGDALAGNQPSRYHKPTLRS